MKAAVTAVLDNDFNKGEAGPHALVHGLALGRAVVGMSEELSSAIVINAITLYGLMLFVLKSIAVF